MPLPSPILDHLVIDVRDRMDEAARTFAGLGFELTPRGHHTLGSMNHLAMFRTDYLELLGFGEGGASRPELAPFPVGLNGLVFKTADADVVHAHALAAGLPILPVQAFSRPVELAGVSQDARFRTTRLDPAKIAMGRVYFCEHLTPELVWRPEWQSHPNGAYDIIGPGRRRHSSIRCASQRCSAACSAPKRWLSRAESAFLRQAPLQSSWRRRLQLPRNSATRLPNPQGATNILSGSNCG